MRNWPVDLQNGPALSPLPHHRCRFTRRVPSHCKKQIETLQLGTVEFIHGKAEDVVLEGEFDCITSCYLAKYADLRVLAEHAHHMLREGGMFIMHELTYPSRLAYASGFTTHISSDLKSGNGNKVESFPVLT